jgi:hypothetical protein
MHGSSKRRYSPANLHGISAQNTTILIFKVFVGFAIQCCFPEVSAQLYAVILFTNSEDYLDRLCGLVVRVLGYRSGGPGSIAVTTRKKSSGSGTGSTQPREYN